jgi:hypothetical protein
MPWLWASYLFTSLSGGSSLTMSHSPFLPQIVHASTGEAPGAHLRRVGQLTFQALQMQRVLLSQRVFPFLMCCLLLPSILVPGKQLDFMSVVQPVPLCKSKRSSREAYEADNNPLISSKHEKSQREHTKSTKDRLQLVPERPW